MLTVELHRHFEAGITPLILSELAQKNEINEIKDRDGNVISDEDPKDPEGIKRFYRLIQQKYKKWNGFTHFQHSFGLPISIVKSLDDLTCITKKQLIEQQKMGSIHTELRVAPYLYSEGIKERVSYEDVILAIQKGIDEVWIEKKMSSTIIISLSRRKSPLYGEKTVETTLKLQKEGYLIGYDIASGPEHEYPPSMFEDLVNPLYQANVPITIHAGEQGIYPRFTTSPASYVKDSILKLHASRIGHGISIMTDQSVVDLVKKTKTCLEFCPVSNDILGFIPLEAHPLKKFLSEGLVVTMSTDDPLMFNVNSVNEIYHVFKEELDLTDEDMRTLTKNGIKSAFVTEERRDFLFEQFHAKSS